MKRQWTVGKRIGAGFGVVIITLGIVAGWSILGFNQVVGNLGEAVECNVLQNEVCQKEIDHLKWAKAVSDLLTDDAVSELAVQTDPHKCAFGKWYYGEGRQLAEKLVPECKTALAAIEEPHRRLHESATKIGEVFAQADATLPAFLAEKENDHLHWINGCMALFAENLARLEVETDEHQCGLGKFLYGEAAQRVAATDPAMAELIEAIKKPTRRTAPVRHRHPAELAAATRGADRRSERPAG